METVKEFKAAGLVFVDGDSCVDRYGDTYSVDWYIDTNKLLNIFNDCFVTEFAWRKNTGEKPNYKGLVEITYSGEGCEMKEVRNTDSINWLNVNEWRPIISKEDKMEGKTNNPRANERVEIPVCAPTYTKEMHEAGELPPVGSKFMLAKKVDCQRIDAFQGSECTVIGHCKDLDGDDVITFSETSRGYACMLHIPEFIKPIDNRTDEEKLIDEACAEMLAIDATPVDTSEKAVIELMIKAGYRKP